MNQNETLTGSIERVVFKNEQNGYTVLELGTKEELHTITGIMPGVQVGEELSVTGVWTSHPTFGPQFKADSIVRVRPSSAEAILKYLSSGAIKGVGLITAQRIVDAFGSEALLMIEQEPLRLCQIKGITKKKALAMSEELRRDSGMREMVVSLGQYGIVPNEALRIWKIYGSSYEAQLRADPYCLCEDVFGIDFYRADAIATQMNRLPEDPCRIRAGILYVLRHNLYHVGHTCLPVNKLIDAAARLLTVAPSSIEDILAELIQVQSVISRKWNQTEFIFSAPVFASESYITHRLKLLLRYPATPIAGIQNHIAAVEAQFHMQYAPKQKEAIVEALDKGLLILTGGPGTGKTTTLQAIIRILKEKGETVFLAAPTGRAAKRMSELTGEEAKTIHRMLQVEWDDSDRPAFAKNEKNLLECDAVVIDELSMVDVPLFESLLRALPLGCRLILVGDSDQLPSVGPGNVLGDLIATGLIPMVQLHEIFRQAMESLIVTNAHRVVRGEMPELYDKTNDFFLLPVHSAEGIIHTILDLCERRLPARYHYSPLWDIQVLAPGRKGKTGTIVLNRQLQEALNPPSPTKREYVAGAQVFRCGDKVMQIRNNYDILWERDDGTTGEGIFNGDIGVIESIDKRAGVLHVRMEDKLISYAFEQASELELAYALTIHKSQGNEFQAVVLPLYPGAPQLAYRNLFYTAITRAKSLLILVGQEAVVSTMIENDRKTKRYTGLYSLMTQAE